MDAFQFFFSSSFFSISVYMYPVLLSSYLSRFHLQVTFCYSKPFIHHYHSFPSFAIYSHSLSLDFMIFQFPFQRIRNGLTLFVCFLLNIPLHIHRNLFLRQQYRKAIMRSPCFFSVLERVYGGAWYKVTPCPLFPVLVWRHNDLLPTPSHPPFYCWIYRTPLGFFPLT